MSRSRKIKINWDNEIWNGIAKQQLERNEPNKKISTESELLNDYLESRKLSKFKQKLLLQDFLESRLY